jgi:hypothetical protein
MYSDAHFFQLINNILPDNTIALPTTYQQVKHDHDFTSLIEGIFACTGWRANLRLRQARVAEGVRSYRTSSACVSPPHLVCLAALTLWI